MKECREAVNILQNSGLMGEIIDNWWCPVVHYFKAPPTFYYIFGFCSWFSEYLLILILYINMI